MSLHIQLFKKGFDIQKSRADIDAAYIGVISKNEGANEGAKKVFEKILKDISQNPMTKPSEIEVFINKSNATTERYLKTLRENNFIEYVGSSKT